MLVQGRELLSALARQLPSLACCFPAAASDRKRGAVPERVRKYRQTHPVYRALWKSVKRNGLSLGFPKFLPPPAPTRAHAVTPQLSPAPHPSPPQYRARSESPSHRESAPRPLAETPPTKSVCRDPVGPLCKEGPPVHREMERRAPPVLVLLQGDRAKPDPLGPLSDEGPVLPEDVDLQGVERLFPLAVWPSQRLGLATLTAVPEPGRGSPWPRARGATRTSSGGPAGRALGRWGKGHASSGRWSWGYLELDEPVSVHASRRMSFQIPAVTKRGPQSHPNWHCSLRIAVHPPTGNYWSPAACARSGASGCSGWRWQSAPKARCALGATAA